MGAMPEESPLEVNIVRRMDSTASTEDWTGYLSGQRSIRLPANTKHYLEIQAACHSTAFVRFQCRDPGREAKLTIQHSESYERGPKDDPTYRDKGDRLDAAGAYLVGGAIDLHDEVELAALPLAKGICTYEPFWFRTFRFLVLEVETGEKELELVHFEATQTNYPLKPKAYWKEMMNPVNEAIWDVSVRTLRNCVFDGYSDCPFYEQLQ